MKKVKSRKLRKHSQEAVDSFKVVSDGLEHRDHCSWDERFEELKKFASNYGHIAVPTHSEHSELGQWFRRSLSNKSIMSEDQQQEFKEFTDRFTAKHLRDLNWENMLIQAKKHFKNYQSFTVKSAHNNKKLRSLI